MRFRLVLIIVQEPTPLLRLVGEVSTHDQDVLAFVQISFFDVLPLITDHLAVDDDSSADIICHLVDEFFQLFRDLDFYAHHVPRDLLFRFLVKLRALLATDH